MPYLYPAVHSQAKLNAVARQLNERKRKTQTMKSPHSPFTSLLRRSVESADVERAGPGNPLFVLVEVAAATVMPWCWERMTRERSLLSQAEARRSWRLSGEAFGLGYDFQITVPDWRWGMAHSDQKNDHEEHGPETGRRCSYRQSDGSPSTLLLSHCRHRRFRRRSGGIRAVLPRSIRR